MEKTSTGKAAVCRSLSPGAFASGESITFTASIPSKADAQIVLYRRGTEEIVSEIPFPKTPWTGDVRCLTVDGVDPSALEYNFRIDGKIVTDPAARIVKGREPFGDLAERSEHRIRGGFLTEKYNWGEDKSPSLAYEDVIAYCIHVRGFTMSKASRVRHPGTFEGIAEKAGYLEKLGVNQIILMPACEFEEVMRPENSSSYLPAPPAGSGQKIPSERMPGLQTGASGEIKSPVRLNYWGYTTSWYYAPKAAYCSGDRPDIEFKKMVKTLHHKGIEVIMEFAFPDATDPAFATNVLSFWRREYHVDGFRLMTNDVIANAAASCPFLSDAKLICGYFDLTHPLLKGPDALQRTSARSFHEGTLADWNDGFRLDCRRFLKGDENMTGAFAGRMLAYSDQKGILNAVTGHDGFTLCDLVSYDGKHNEANGEDNQDGAPSEFSWNCGEEGPTRKKNIRDLRLRQMKNAFAMLLLGQGTPVILSGDELCNSQSGNSNPYCIDSELTWLDWRKDAVAKDLFAFVQELIRFRKAHRMLRGIDEKMANAGGAGGYPMSSCHSSKAWFASNEYQDRHIGIMFCGAEDGRDSYIYLAFNLHWEEREFALPYLPEDLCWRTAISTDRREAEYHCRSVVLAGRSVMVLTGEPKEAGQQPQIQEES